MFKRALKVAIAFGVLLAGYAGYIRVFAFVATRVILSQPTLPKFPEQSSRSKREAIELARRTFGRNHWSTAEDLSIRHYSVEQGYWMYAERYERLNEGKVLELQPFTIIWRSRDGKEVKTATSDKAIIEFNRPIGLVSKPGEPGVKIIRARMVGDVRLRDDKGTPTVPEDDLFVGPLTYIEYEEKSLQIMSETDVVIQDRDMRITGYNLLIQLRPKPFEVDSDLAERPNGFNGAQTAYLRKNVHVVINDVGKTGVLARPEEKQAGKTPLDLRCDGEMRIDLPKPKVRVAVGPPEPPAPTFAEFSRNVEVEQGKPNQVPDQIFCDNLRLTFYPAEKPDAAKAPAQTEKSATEAAVKTAATKPATAAAVTTVEKPATEEGGASQDGGPLTDLALRRAEATGHAVRVVSQSQGVTAICNELIYKKLRPEAADETYFRGDATALLRVEKIDLVRSGPDMGKVQSVTHIRAIDATIFDEGTGNENAKVVTRGPGILETRPGLNQPIDHVAVWQDQLVMLPEPGPEPVPIVRKKITLTGFPKFVDGPGTPKETTLDSLQTIVVWLKPKVPVAAPPTAKIAKAEARTAADAKAAAPPNAPAGGQYELEQLVALDHVHLTTPGKVMTAYERLDARFTTEPAAPAPPDAPAGAATAPAPDETAQAAPAGEAGVEPPAQPAEPNVTVAANRVWAEVLQHPAPAATAGPGQGVAAARGEVQKVYLRGKVAIHQDPDPGETVGTDVAGAAADMFNQGNGRSKFLVYNHMPSENPAGAAAPSPEAEARLAAERNLAAPAQIITKEMTVEGPIIGLNQATDDAWVDGPGKLILMTDRGLMTDKKAVEPEKTGPQPPSRNARAAVATTVKTQPKPTKEPLTIWWRDEMKFFGHSTDPQGKPAGRAEFFTGVRAETQDGLLVCQDMKVYMDRPVNLARPPRPDAKTAANDPAQPPEPKPDIALIECFENAVAIARKVDRTEPKHPVFVQQYQVEGNYLNYDKITGNFLVPGPGTVLLWGLEGGNDAVGGTTDPVPAPKPPARPITRTANPASRPGTIAARTGEPAKPKVAAVAPKQLVQTRITFSKLMKGRVGMGKETDKTETRWAEFFGEVESIHGRVPDLKTRINPDKPPEGFASLTSQTMRLISEPPPPGAPESTPARNFLKAWDDAQAIRADLAISGDVITYDSFKDLYYAYGLDGREVILKQQKNPGQPFSLSRGKTAFFNHKTGESKLDQPSAFQLIDTKTGDRPKFVKPPVITPPKPTRKLRRPARNSMDRKGFSGGQ